MEKRQLRFEWIFDSVFIDDAKKTPLLSPLFSIPCRQFLFVVPYPLGHICYSFAIGIYFLAISCFWILNWVISICFLNPRMGAILVQHCFDPTLAASFGVLHPINNIGGLLCLADFTELCNSYLWHTASEMLASSYAIIFSALLQILKRWQGSSLKTDFEYRRRG